MPQKESSFNCRYTARILNCLSIKTIAMAQVSTIESTQKDSRINIHKSADIAYWTQQLGVSVINLKIAVSETDGSARKVEEWLRMKQFIK